MGDDLVIKKEGDKGFTSRNGNSVLFYSYFFALFVL